MDADEDDYLLSAPMTALHRIDELRMDVQYYVRPRRSDGEDAFSACSKPREAEASAAA